MKDIHKDVLGQSEDALQQKCIFWFHNEYPHLRGLLFSIPNGGDRSGKEGKTLRLTGLMPGVSDLIFLYRTQAYLIEIKTNSITSKQTKPQQKWQEIVEYQGFNYFIAKSLEDFRRLMNQLIVV